MLLDSWGDGCGHVHEILAGRLVRVLLAGRVRTIVFAKVIFWDSAIVHIEHVKLLFLRDHVILMILLCPLVGVPVLCLVCLSRM
jgi:hypothetical protein